MQVEAKLAELGLALPPAFQYPSPNRRGTVRWGDLLFVSGHSPSAQLDAPRFGKVGGELTEEEGYAAARSAALNLLASVRQEVGDLDRVARVLKVLGFVNVAPGFNRPSNVINGASDLLHALWGDAGVHARSAVGVAELANGVAVEVEAVLALGPDA